MTRHALFARPARLLAAAALLVGLGAATTAEAVDRVFRIGYQKYGTLILLKGKGALEEKLKPLGVEVKWAEFQFGPPLLEAVAAGAIDFGSTGESPPVFAQIANPKLVYVASNQPSPKAEALLVPGDSPIKTLADLKGKKVAVAKGSNAHYLLVKAVEKGGLSYGDITPVFLTPSDARAAFQTGAVDAWAVWDPYYASAQVAGARVLTDGEGLVYNYQYFLSDRGYAEKNGDILRILLTELRNVEESVRKDPKAAAAELSPAIGIPAPLLETAISRQGFGVGPVKPDVVARQQKVADTFLELKLIPKAVTVSDAVIEVTQ